MEILQLNNESLIPNHFKPDLSVLGLKFSEDLSIIEFIQDRDGPRRCALQAVRELL